MESGAPLVKKPVLSPDAFEYELALVAVLMGPHHLRLDEAIRVSIAVGEQCQWETLRGVADSLLLMGRAGEDVFSVLQERLPEDWVVNCMWREVIWWDRELTGVKMVDARGVELSPSGQRKIVRDWAHRLRALEREGADNRQAIDALLDWNRRGVIPAMTFGISLPLDESDSLVTLIRALGPEPLR